jgi:hypothetical protein
MNFEETSEGGKRKRKKGKKKGIIGAVEMCTLLTRPVFPSHTLYHTLYYTL